MDYEIAAREVLHILLDFQVTQNLLLCFSLRMRSFKQLAWSLPVFVDLSENGSLLKDLLYQIELHCSFVRSIQEQVEALLCLLSPLFVTENQIDPMVQVGGCVLTLQSLSVCLEEVFRTFGPLGEYHVVDLLPVLHSPEVQVLLVCQKA